MYGVRRTPFSYTAQSNASLKVYPDNKENNFKIHLPIPIELESGPWLVGLSEIHYMCDFKPHIDPKKQSQPPGSEKLIPIESSEYFAELNDSARRKRRKKRNLEDMTGTLVKLLRGQAAMDTTEHLKRVKRDLTGIDTEDKDVGAPSLRLPLPPRWRSKKLISSHLPNYPANVDEFDISSKSNMINLLQNVGIIEIDFQTVWNSLLRLDPPYRLLHVRDIVREDSRRRKLLPHQQDAYNLYALIEYVKSKVPEYDPEAIRYKVRAGKLTVDEVIEEFVDEIEAALESSVCNKEIRMLFKEAEDRLLKMDLVDIDRKDLLQRITDHPRSWQGIVGFFIERDQERRQLKVNEEFAYTFDELAAYAGKHLSRTERVDFQKVHQLIHDGAMPIDEILEYAIRSENLIPAERRVISSTLNSNSRRVFKAINPDGSEFELTAPEAEHMLTEQIEDILNSQHADHMVDISKVFIWRYVDKILLPSPGEDAWTLSMAVDAIVADDKRKRMTPFSSSSIENYGHPITQLLEYVQKHMSKNHQPTELEIDWDVVERHLRNGRLVDDIINELVGVDIQNRQEGDQIPHLYRNPQPTQSPTQPGSLKISSIPTLPQPPLPPPPPPEVEEEEEGTLTDDMEVESGAGEVKDKRAPPFLVRTIQAIEKKDETHKKKFRIAEARRSWEKRWGAVPERWGPDSPRSATSTITTTTQDPPPPDSQTRGEGRGEDTMLLPATVASGKPSPPPPPPTPDPLNVNEVKERELDMHNDRSTPNMKEVAKAVAKATGKKELEIHHGDDDDDDDDTGEWWQREDGGNNRSRDAVEHIARVLQDAGVQQPDLREIRRRIKTGDTEEKIIEGMFDSHRAKLLGRDNVDQAFMYVISELTQIGVLGSKLDLYDLVKRIEHSKNLDLDELVDDIAQRISLNFRHGHPLPPRTNTKKKPSTPTTTFIGRNMIMDQDNDHRVLTGLSKLRMLDTEIRNRKRSNRTAPPHLRLPIIALQDEMVRTIRRVVNMFKDMDVYFLTPDDLRQRLEDGRIVGDDEIVNGIWAEHQKRLEYDKYAMKLRKCKTVPKFLYVYCTVAENTLVGNLHGPFLRVVDVPIDGTSKSVSRDYTSPHYKPVSGNYFHVLEVDIRDETGCPVSFNDGPLIVTLHFIPLKVYLQIK
jgi:hypothetical protein